MTLAQQQPLAGIRIVDFTHDWAGPHAVRVMGDYGAEVIKIEYRKRLDGMRGAYLDRIEKHPRWWEINRNKLGITLDLKNPEHADALRALVRVADIVVENSRPGVIERLGFGYDALKVLRPDIIMVSMSAYGGYGPESRYAGYGGAIEALSGVQSLTGYSRDGDPMRVREVDVTNGVMGACAIMTALVHRQETGEGQWVDLAQREASSWLIGEHLLEYAVNGTQTLPLGNRHPVYAPQGCYPCTGEDRWLVLTIRSESEWKALCQVAEHSDWRQDARFASTEARHAYHDELDKLISDWTRNHSARQLMERLQAAGVPAAMVADAQDIAEDPHLQARAWIQKPDGDEHPGYPGFPFRFERGGGVFSSRGPALGEHNKYVLCDLLGLPAQILESAAADALGTAFDLEDGVSQDKN